MIRASGSEIGSRIADRPVVDAAERDDRGAGALGAERGEGLRVAALDERGHRQQLGGRDHALTASAMDAHLEHLSAPNVPAGHGSHLRSQAPAGVRGDYADGCVPTR